MDAFKRGWLILLLAAVFWFDSPIERIVGPGSDHAALAKGGSNSGSGSGNSGSGSSGSGGSGSGSSGGGHDDDDDNSGSGGGNSGPGGGGTPGSGPSRSSPGGAHSQTGGRPFFTGGGGIHVQYADGRIERVRDGVFEALDRRGRLVERHLATGQEERRLKSLETNIAHEGSRNGVVVAAEIDERTGSAEITDYRGWREKMWGGRYQLSDPGGRTVARRGLKATDVARLRTMLFLD